MSDEMIQSTVARLVDLHGTAGLSKSATDWETILRLGAERPIGLVNLIRSVAPADSGGPQQYDRYASQVSEVFEEVGGRLVVAGAIGYSFGTSGHARYDRLVITSYPSGQALADMWLDERYVEADGLRRSGIETATICLLAGPLTAPPEAPAVAHPPLPARDVDEIVGALVEKHGEGDAAPTGEDWRAIFRIGGAGPFALVNTLMLRSDHAGGAGRAGADDYARYRDGVAAAFQDAGGWSLGSGAARAIWGRQPERDIDHVTLTWYPSAQALAGMWLDPRFVAAHEHRRRSIAVNTVHIAALGSAPRAVVE